MKYLIICIVLFFNTSCATWLLSNADRQYNDEINEVSKNEVLTGYLAKNYNYKGDKGTLISIDNCLIGHNRLLHVFISDKEANQDAVFFEDDDLSATYSKQLYGKFSYYNLFRSPYKSENEELGSRESSIQTRDFSNVGTDNFLLMTPKFNYRTRYRSFSIYYDGKSYSGYAKFDYEERSLVRSVLYKPLYFVTVPIDAVTVVIVAPFLPFLVN